LIEKLKQENFNLEQSKKREQLEIAKTRTANPTIGTAVGLAISGDPNKSTTSKKGQMKQIYNSICQCGAPPKFK
jgi:hypothetical protein